MKYEGGIENRQGSVACDSVKDLQKLVYDTKTHIVMNPGTQSHQKVAVHSVHDATVSWSHAIKIFDTISTLYCGSEIFYQKMLPHWQRGQAKGRVFVWDSSWTGLIRNDRARG